MNKNRWVVEGRFGSIKRWPGSDRLLLQRIRAYACPAYYKYNMVHNLYRALELL
ncbi:MAG: hypothetical protein ACMUEL_00185 [Flavobacteriales bacterium Tduv]